MGGTELLIVEDHPLFRSGLRHMADAHRPDWQIRFAGTSAAALAAIDDAVPDIAVVDIGLPGEDGFDLARTITRRWPDLRVLMISAQDTPQMMALADRSGARGFVSKSEPPRNNRRCDRRRSGGRPKLSVD